MTGGAAGAQLRPVETAPAAEKDVGVRVAGVAKTFGEVHALSAVDFEIRRGEFVSVLGPSGCGKSTLLRIVAGLLEADVGGSVEILGESQRAPSERVGVVFQTHNMLPWMTVAANIRLAAEVRGLPAEEINARVDAILPVLRLEGFRDHYPHQLSGGMRQRAALGQTLVLQPQVLLLDEPFGALDALTRDQLNVELLRLWQELRKTVMLITHSIAEAVFLSDRVLVMSDRPGRIVEEVHVPLPRPRDPGTTKARPEFGVLVARLNKLMGVE